MAKCVMIYGDGASRGNPGPASYGVVFKDETGTVIHECKDRIGNNTNNVAEYRSLIAGLAGAIDLGFSDVKMHLDSQLVVRQMIGQYRVKNAILKPLYEQAKMLEKKLSHCEYIHIPRELNSEADALANQALDQLL